MPPRPFVLGQGGKGGGKKRGGYGRKKRGPGRGVGDGPRRQDTVPSPGSFNPACFLLRGQSVQREKKGPRFEGEEEKERRAPTTTPNYVLLT